MENGIADYKAFLIEHLDIGYRENDFNIWLSDFRDDWGVDIISRQDLHVSVPVIEYSHPIDEISRRLYNWYVETLIARVKRRLIHNTNEKDPIVDHYKIISGTELTIMYIMPILHQDPDTRKFLNAHLAIYIGNRILGDWEKIHVDQVDESFDEVEDKHFLWLAKFDPSTNYPIINNSLFWNLKSVHINLCSKQQNQSNTNTGEK